MYSTTNRLGRANTTEWCIDKNKHKCYSESMIDNIKSKPNAHERSREQKFARRFLPALALFVAAGGYAGYEIKEKAEYHPVATVVGEVKPGETPIDTVRDAVDSMGLMTESGTPVEITGVVREGQEVSEEIAKQGGGRFVQPGDAIKVVVAKNGFGSYDVEADPAEKTE